MTSSTNQRQLTGLGTAWALGALLLGASGLLLRLPPVATPALLLLLVVALLLLDRTRPAVRAWAGAVPVGAILALHLVRFVGVWFLLLVQAGELPREFGVPAGIGDILAATGAVALLLTGVRSGPALRWWNLLGMLDIVFVVISAGRMNLTRPGSMHTLAVLPLSLLPTLVVPLIIVSHLELFRRERLRARA